MKDIDIFSADNKTIRAIADYINITLDNIVLANSPVYEGLTSIKTRCLISVGLECDVYICGVPNITPTNLHEFLLKLVCGTIVNDYYEIIMNKYLAN
jgi:hypothetical protein